MSKRTERAVAPGRRKLIKQTAALTVAAAAAQFGFPAILRAQSDTIRIGHITPRTGFLGQVGEYGYKGAMLAVEEANAAGGVLGRKIEMIAEDSVNPATAVTKANKLVERDQPEPSTNIAIANWCGFRFGQGGSWGAAFLLA